MDKTISSLEVLRLKLCACIRKNAVQYLKLFYCKTISPSKDIINDFLGASKEFGKSRTM
jgi:hypothetical protein